MTLAKQPNGNWWFLARDWTVEKLTVTEKDEEGNPTGETRPYFHFHSDDGYSILVRDENGMTEEEAAREAERYIVEASDEGSVDALYIFETAMGVRPRRP